MAFLKIENVAIKGISACVPPSVEENKDIPFYAPGEAEKIIASTGIERRHIAGPDICVSDLCFRAADPTTGTNQLRSWFMNAWG